MPMDPQPAVEVTRSEEELVLSTEWTPTGRVRISKRITRQTETRTFEVRREELVVHHLDAEPAASPAPDAPQEQTPLVFELRREELVVSKRLAPYERVTVTVDRLTEERPVEATLRKERLEATTDPERLP